MKRKRDAKHRMKTAAGSHTIGIRNTGEGIQHMQVPKLLGCLCMWASRWMINHFFTAHVDPCMHVWVAYSLPLPPAARKNEIALDVCFSVKMQVRETFLKIGKQGFLYPERPKSNSSLGICFLYLFCTFPLFRTGTYSFFLFLRKAIDFP